MGIQVEFNPDLALRNWSEHEKGNREAAECVPQDLRAGDVHSFLKKGQRNYWLHGEIPLLVTQGNEKLSRPIASIQILEAIHFLDDNEMFTKGSYRVVEVFSDDQPHFNSYARV